jgi:hypothetical protein
MFCQYIVHISNCIINKIFAKLALCWQTVDLGTLPFTLQSELCIHRKSRQAIENNCWYNRIGKNLRRRLEWPGKSLVPM